MPIEHKTMPSEDIAGGGVCARVQASPDVVAARRWRGLVAVEAGGASSSYIQQDRDEMEVLFTFLAERYERKSVVITSNLVFSQWDRIFKDPMTTAAAIDRLVHHSVILQLSGKSYRGEAAKLGRAPDPETNPEDLP